MSETTAASGPIPFNDVPDPPEGGPRAQGSVKRTPRPREIESGWRSATPANLLKFADALNCPLVSLERKRPQPTQAP